MARKKRVSKRAARGRRPARRSAAHDVSEEELQGPPPAEALLSPSDRERAAAAEREDYTSTGPELTGGDVDADWRRAGQVGEETPGGTVATPDQDVVDELGEALGVPRPPDAEFRPSAEILEGRDRRRWEQEAEGARNEDDATQRG